MPAVAELTEELNEMTTLKFVSAAFAEAAAAKIGKIRDAFFHNAKYYDEIGQLYHIVKVSSEVKKKLKKKEPEAAETEDIETASVAITSNHRFFGPLNINTMQEFVQETQSAQTNRFIIGQTGVDYMTMIHFEKKYEPVIFEKDYPTDQESSNFLQKISGFKKIFLYYPKFKTMLSQVVEKVDITKTPDPVEVDKQQIIRYLFEPELSQILKFFELQVKSLLFTRAMLEAELSRTAARLMSMSAAEEKADELIHEKKMEISKLKSSIANMQLLETFSGIRRWKKM